MIADPQSGQTNDQDGKHHDHDCLGHLPSALGCSDCLLWILGHEEDELGFDVRLTTFSYHRNQC
jgi:hypothetical protein